MSRGLQLRALLDAGVPDSVADTFQSFGHVAILHRNVLLDASPDELVCATALENEAILIAIDGDMKQFPKRYGITPKGNRFETLNIIRLCCVETLAAKRLEQAMSLIEHEWKFTKGKTARRLWIDIEAHRIKTNR